MPTVSLLAPSADLTSDAVVVGAVRGKKGVTLAPGAAAVEQVIGKPLAAALATLDLTGKPDEVAKVPTLGTAPFPLLVVTGLGDDAGDAEAVRRGVGAALRALRGRPTVQVAIDAPADVVAEGALLGSYAFTAYKSAASTARLRRITLAGEGRTAKAALARAKIVAEAITTVRDLVNTPPNDLYPASFAERARDLATQAKLEVEIFDEKALRRERFGGILGVGQGSARPPRLVRIAYRPASATATVALVGKGITFDSGGLNLKTAKMEQMKADMGGAAAMIASVCAIAALKLPVAVVATIPMAENLPGGGAYRPSDVLTFRNGRTVEIGNTDAEGRLILGDAIARAVEDGPDYLIEASTLTGAQGIALGDRVIGAMGEPAWRDAVAAAGNAVGEAVWPMPLPEDLRHGLDSPVADLVNVTGERAGGMLVGGHFLADFVPRGLPWVHLDIAGPAFNAKGPYGYTPTGGTGAGVRTVIAAVERLAT